MTFDGAMDFQFSRFEILTGTGALFLCLVFTCLFMEAGAIQAQIGTAGAAALAREDLFWASAEADGQHLVLTGAAPDYRAQTRATELAAAIPGVSGVDNRIAIVGQEGTCQNRVDDYLADRRVSFKSGGAVLTESSLATLTMIAGIARGCGASFEIAGHTDDRGDSAVNLKLSQRRAEAVVRHLVSSGVPATQLRAVGYGETQPLADNTSDAGRTANRRIEFRIIGDVAS